jgi:hypothetical protein
MVEHRLEVRLRGLQSILVRPYTLSLTIHSMPDQPSLEIELLRAAYAAFNARDIDAALTLMTADVAWPRAFKGGFVRGPQAVRAYWTEHWSEIDPHVEPATFHPEGDGRFLVEVHQVVRDLAGSVLADERVGHRFTFKRDLIQGMEVCPLPSSDHPA